MDFNVTIEGLDQFKATMAQAPSIVAPIIQGALSSSLAVLASHTTKGIVPWRTGFLTQSFRQNLTALQGSWGPTASYAPAVEFGVGPSPGRYVPAIGKRLINSARPGFGMWPGFKGRSYMEQILSASQGEINIAFANALNRIVSALATQ